MGAPDILAQLSAMGLTLTVQEETIRAEPKAAVTDEALNLIRTHKAELLAALGEPRTQGETPDKSVTQTANASSASPLPAIETAEGNQYAREPEAINEDCTEYYNERAGIMEYDGGLSREDAEAAAREATEKHRQACWDRFEKAADAILSLGTWEARLNAVERYRRERGEIAGQEMMGWVRHKSGLDH